MRALSVFVSESIAPPFRHKREKSWAFRTHQLKNTPPCFVLWDTSTNSQSNPLTMNRVQPKSVTRKALFIYMLNLTNIHIQDLKGIKRCCTASYIMSRMQCRNCTVLFCTFSSTYIFIWYMYIYTLFMLMCM